MGDSLRYTTVESSMFILEQLYDDEAESSFFDCEVYVPLRQEDSVEEGIATIYVERMRTRGHSYTLANDERIYRTRARTPAMNDLFDVDIIVHALQFDLTGATVVVSSQIYEIRRKFVTEKAE